jgi:hypothetical protein
MPKGIKTQKTELYFLSNDASPAIIKLGSFNGFSGLGGQKSEIDATDFDSTAKEFFTGLEDSGTFGANINLDPTNAGQDALQQIKDDGTVNKFVLCLSDGIASPTLATDVVTPPTTRTSYMFDASVQQFTVSGDPDNIVKGQVQLRITGAIVRTKKA